MSKIACIFAEIIEQEDGRMCCWMIYNKLQLNALPTSLVFQVLVWFFRIHRCKGTASLGGYPVIR